MQLRWEDNDFETSLGNIVGHVSIKKQNKGLRHDSSGRVQEVLSSKPITTERKKEFRNQNKIENVL
jgi:hypothetical protein